MHPGKPDEHSAFPSILPHDQSVPPPETRLVIPFPSVSLNRYRVPDAVHSIIFARRSLHFPGCRHPSAACRLSFAGCRLFPDRHCLGVPCCRSKTPTTWPIGRETPHYPSARCHTAGFRHRTLLLRCHSNNKVNNTASSRCYNRPFSCHTRLITGERYKTTSVKPTQEGMFPQG